MHQHNHAHTSPQALYDIYDVSITQFWRTAAFHILIAATIILTVIALWWFIRSTILARAAVVLTPLQQAQHTLEQLAATLSSHDAGMVYLVLTDTIKGYLAAHLHQPITDKTDEEMVELLPTLPLAPEVQRSLQDLFKKAVTIKFAKESIAPAQMRDDIVQAMQIIRTIGTSGTSTTK